MNIEQLKQIIDQKEYNAGTKTLHIEDGDFGSENQDIHYLFRAIMDVSFVRLYNAAVVSSDARHIVYQGYAQGAPGLTTETVQAVAIFSIYDEKPQLVLAYNLPAEADDFQNFATYFPKLKETPFDVMRIAAQQPLPRFIYASFQHDNTVLYEGREIALQKGLNFHGAVLPQGHAFETLHLLLGELSNTTFNGPITVYPSGPSFSLLMDQEASLNQLFEKLNLPAQTELFSVFALDGIGYLAGLRLSVQFDLGESKGLTLETILMQANPTITILGQFKNVPLPGPGDLLGWIGGSGNDVEHLLPDELKIGVYLHSLWVTINTSKPVSVFSVGLELGTEEGKAFEIVPDYLSLKDIRTRFEVYQPFSNGRVPRLTLMGEIDIPTRDPVFKMEAGVVFPGISVFAYLADPLDLTKLLGVFLPDVKDAPSLKLDELRLNVDLGQSPKSYQFSAAINEPWRFKFGGETVLEVLYASFHLENNSSGRSGGIKGGIKIFDVETDFAYDMPGNFKMTAHIPEFDIDAPTLVKGLVGNDLNAPVWFPHITFPKTDLYIAHSSGGQTTDTFALRAQPSFGVIVLQVVHTANQWAFAAGLALDTPSLSSFDGLSVVSGLEDWFHIDELLFVFASADMPAFQFPVTSEFAGASTRSRGQTKVALPSGRTIQNGFNFYGAMTIDTVKKKNMKLVQDMFNLPSDLKLQLWANIGLKPAQNAFIQASISGAVNIQGSPVKIDGTIGAGMFGGEPEFYLRGDVTAYIHDDRGRHTRSPLY